MEGENGVQQVVLRPLAHTRSLKKSADRALAWLLADSLQTALCPCPGRAHAHLCDVCSVQKDIPLHFSLGTGQLWGHGQSEMEGRQDSFREYQV